VLGRDGAVCVTWSGGRKCSNSSALALLVQKYKYLRRRSNVSNFVLGRDGAVCVTWSSGRKCSNSSAAILVTDLHAGKP
jgi:hypothetical protein